MANVGDIYSVKAFSSITGPPVQILALNVRFYRVVTTLNLGATDAQISNAMDNFWSGIYLPILPNQTRYRGVIIQRVFPAPLLLAVANTTNANAGQRVLGTLLPAQTCGMITKQTGAAGRAFRGRVYVPFPVEEDNGQSEPNPAYLALIQNMANAEISQIVAGVLPNQNELQQVIFRRTLPANSIPVTNAIVRSRWGTQRRRNPGNGPDTFPL